MISDRISKFVNVRAKIELLPSDPQRLSATIAKIPPPTKEDIPHKSTFKTIHFLNFFSFKHFLGVILASLNSLIEKILIVAG